MHMLFEKSTFSILFFMLLTLAACKKDEAIPETTEPAGILEIRFNPTMNGVPLQANSIFTGPNNQRMLVENFKFYLSGLYLRSDTDSVLIKDVSFVDLIASNKTLKLAVKPGVYKALRYAVGLTPEQNGTNNPNFDEAQFPIDHPQSIYNGMYWSWASGYIFSKIEGKIDTSATQNQTPTFTWFYHSGLDVLYSPGSISDLSIELKDKETTILDLAIEVNDVFRQPGDTINIMNDYFTHTTDNLGLAEKVIRNISKSIKKKE
jgi:hypothetical protein